MGMDLRTHYFYGVQIDPASYPRKAAKLLEEWGNPMEAFSIYLLDRAGHKVENEYDVDDELAAKTGIRVLFLDEEIEGGSVFLIVNGTHSQLRSFGIKRVDPEPMVLEEVLRMETYAKWLGTDTQLGNWYLCSTYE